MTSANSILIIGRNGQVSRSLQEVLTASGHHVAVVGRPEVDLCDRQSLSNAVRLFKPAIVINAAGYTAVDRAEDEPETADMVNAEGAKAAAEAAAAVGATIIHFSTDYVFDGRKKSPYVEIDPAAPLGAYGRSKLSSEKLVSAANPRHIILRTAWLFSPFATNFPKTMLRLAQERTEISVVADQHGNPTYALDLADIVRKIILRLNEPSLLNECFGIFHAVNAGETTWYDFAHAIIDGAAQRGFRRALVRPIGTKDYPTKAVRPAYSVLSTDRLATVYGIELRSWREALSDGLDRLVGPLHNDAFHQPRRVSGRAK